MSDQFQPAENGFINLLLEYEGGLFNESLDRELKDLVNLMRVRGGKGSIKLSVDLKEHTSDEGACALTINYTVTAPKIKRIAELRFPDKDGGLVSDRPDQVDMFRIDQPSLTVVET